MRMETNFKKNPGVGQKFEWKKKVNTGSSWNLHF